MEIKGNSLRGRPWWRWERRVSTKAIWKEGKTWDKIRKELGEERDRWRGMVARRLTYEGGANKSLALWRKQATGLEKMYLLYIIPPELHTWLRCSNFFNPSKKILLVVLQIGKQETEKAKDLWAPICISRYVEGGRRLFHMIVKFSFFNFKIAHSRPSKNTQDSHTQNHKQCTTQIRNLRPTQWKPHCSKQQ
jgi:hypothetical protein